MLTDHALDMHLAAIDEPPLPILASTYTDMDRHLRLAACRAPMPGGNAVARAPGLADAWMLAGLNQAYAWVLLWFALSQTVRGLPGNVRAVCRVIRRPLPAFGICVFVYAVTLTFLVTR